MTLTCPQDANFAAIAKQLHATAVQAENEIYVSEQLMRAAVNLPTVVLVTTSADDFASGVSDIGLALTWDTLYDNTNGTGSPDLSGGFGPQALSDFTRELGSGLYEVGMCLTVVATGAVTDNSLRDFVIQHFHPDPLAPTGEVEVQRTTITLLETNTGVGVEAGIAGHFSALAGDRFAFVLSHSNASSLDVNAGALIWASKISDSTLTRVL